MCKILSTRFQVITPNVGRFLTLVQNLFGGVSGAEQQVQDDPVIQHDANL